MLRITPKNKIAGPLLRATAALFMAVALMTSTAHAAEMTVDQVISMHKAGLPPALIKQTIQSTGAKFSLSVSDVKKLKKAGVAQSVIDSMTQSSGSAAPAPEPAPAPAGQPDELQMLQDQEAAEVSRIKEEARAREVRPFDVPAQKNIV